jgi:peptidoglycan/xylan/chitin deacetylase (PgdA/CDA1 family)
VYLKRHFEFVPLNDYLLDRYIPETNKPLCAVGFDDGYRDYLDYALPILQKYNCPSSMYIVTNCIDEDLPPWTYILNHCFINTDKLQINLNTNDFPGHLKNTRWRSKAERIQFARQLNPYMKSLNNSERQRIYHDIVNEFNDVKPPKGLMLTWDEIKKLKDYKCEVGSHTFNHPVLSKKLSVDELAFELERSGKVIQNHTGAFPETISYPFGAYNEDVKKASLLAGYKLGVTVNPGTYDSSRHDLFEVPRIELFDEPFLKTRLRINEIIPQIRKILTLKG